jgi:hypothetical protein
MVNYYRGENTLYIILLKTHNNPKSIITSLKHTRLGVSKEFTDHTTANRKSKTITQTNCPITLFTKKWQFISFLKNDSKTEQLSFGLYIRHGVLPLPFPTTCISPNVEFN